MCYFLFGITLVELLFTWSFFLFSRLLLFVSLNSLFFFNSNFTTLVFILVIFWRLRADVTMKLSLFESLGCGSGWPAAILFVIEWRCFDFPILGEKFQILLLLLIGWKQKLNSSKQASCHFMKPYAWELKWTCLTWLNNEFISNAMLRDNDVC